MQSSMPCSTLTIFKEKINLSDMELEQQLLMFF